MQVSKKRYDKLVAHAKHLKQLVANIRKKYRVLAAKENKSQGEVEYLRTLALELASAQQALANTGCD